MNTPEPNDSAPVTDPTSAAPTVNPDSPVAEDSVIVEPPVVAEDPVIVEPPVVAEDPVIVEAAVLSEGTVIPEEAVTPEPAVPPTTEDEPSIAQDADAGRPAADRSAAQSEFGPLYAVAGLTDVLAASLRRTLQQTQERAALRMSLLRDRPAELERQAKINAEELSRLLRSVPDQARTLPETTVARMNELQKQLHAYLEEASLTYAELAGRGKRAVDGTLATARHFSGWAERKAAHVTADAAEAVAEQAVAERDAARVAEREVEEQLAEETAAREAAEAETPEAETPEVRASDSDDQR